jgi:2-aminoethylphosphonate transport system permease protein
MATTAAITVPAARLPRALRTALVLLPIVVVLVVLIGYPLVLLFLESLRGDSGPTLARYARILSRPYYQKAILDTLKIAVGATILSTIIGVAVAFLLTFTAFPARGLSANLFNLMIVFPSFLAAFSLIFVFGSSGTINIALQRLLGLPRPPLDFIYSWKGIVLADTIFYTPFVLQPVLAAFRMLNPAMIEAAQSLGSRGFHTVRKIVLPVAMPGIFAGSSLCFLLTLNEFGIVLFLGSTSEFTLPVVIHTEAFVNSDLAMSAAVAMLSSTLALVLFAVYRRLVGELRRW